jgi:hypothetical protein
MNAALAPIRPLRLASDVASAVSQISTENPAGSEPEGRANQKGLSALESSAGFLVFVLWLVLFAAGIVVDTEPYRNAISPAGVAALRSGGPQRNDPVTETLVIGSGSGGASPAGAPRSIVGSWLVVVFCFLPLNLAWLCAASSTLGGFGSRANLSDDQADKDSRDNSNPYMSAILRGFFVYLFMTSGLLLLDDSPFSNSAPAQYIRLAGFLSLFSFVVSYHPRLFSTLISAAFQRIQVRDGESATSMEGESETVVKKETTVAVATHTVKDSEGSE